MQKVCLCWLHRRRQEQTSTAADPQGPVSTHAVVAIATRTAAWRAGRARKRRRQTEVC